GSDPLRRPDPPPADDAVRRRAHGAAGALVSRGAAGGDRQPARPRGRPSRAVAEAGAAWAARGLGTMIAGLLELLADARRRRSGLLGFTCYDAETAAGVLTAAAGRPVVMLISSQLVTAPAGDLIVTG